MLSSPLTAPLINERAIHSWWGPNRHWICGPKSNGQSYDASFFIHPTASSPLPASHVSASNSHDPGKDKDNDRRGDVREVTNGVQTYGYEKRVQAFAKMIPPENCTLWKVTQLPDLPTWVSESGRIVLLGDAAHAMSPHLGQGAAMTIEDGGVLSECLARASSLDDIPRAAKVYEKVQKERTEKVKKAAEISGVWKTMAEGPEQRRRDEGFMKRMERGNKYEFWRASGHLAWIYGWDFKLEAGKELDKVFPVGKAMGQRARI
jgi:salicylate hydroxylase